MELILFFCLLIIYWLKRDLRNAEAKRDEYETALRCLAEGVAHFVRHERGWSVCLKDKQ